MSTRSNNQSHIQSTPLSGTSGGASVEQGTWMYYEQATIATGKSEKTLKRYIKKGDLKWRRMGKQVNSPVQVWITPAFIASFGGEPEHYVDDPEVFEAESQEVDFAPEADLAPPPEPAQRSTDAYERMVKLMVSEFTEQLDRQREVLYELRKELVEKEDQLRLLPDLQRKLDERETEAHLQSAALAKQIEALQANGSAKDEKIENLQAEVETTTKTLAELQQENEALKREAETLRSKRGFWSWFTGRQ